MTLDQVEHARCIIVKIRGSAETHLRLLRSRLVVGAVIEVNGSGLSDNLISVKAGGRELFLERDIAANIGVEMA